MDFGAREILILLGILVIVAILLDGVRRVSRARHGKLRTSTRRASRNAPIFDDEDYPAELFNRGSRIVEVRDEDSVMAVSEKIKRDCDYTRNRFTSPFRARDEQGREELGPVDSEINPFDESAPQPPLEEHRFTSSDVGEAADSMTSAAARSDGNVAEERRSGSGRFAAPGESGGATGYARSKGDDNGFDTRDGSQFFAAPDRGPERAEESFAPAQKSTHNRSASPQKDILVLHLVAHKGQHFEGEKLLEQLLANGLRYGAMRIFHRHDTSEGTGAVHFSVANLVNPGVFDLAIMDQFSTPGVTFIMPLDGLEKPLESFETLMATAVGMARKLDGELKDETRSALTKQTIEHYRQRIIDYTRRSFTLTN